MATQDHKRDRIGELEAALSERERLLEATSRRLLEAEEALRVNNERLARETEQNRAARQRIEDDQSRLRRLATELSLAEARERREIAVALHDDIIQEFAFIKLRIAQFRGDSVFYGFERNLDEILALLERGIRQTRRLTFELSPPILYDLGLGPALEWLAERYRERHQLEVLLDVRLPRPEGLSEAIRVTVWKCVQELLTNVVKYAGVRTARLSLHREGPALVALLQDDGAGFDTGSLASASSDRQGFGLFSIRERIRSLGGEMALRSALGEGTSIRLTLPMEG